MMIRNILDYLEKSADSYPDKIALRDENIQVTYSEYVTEAKRIATYLAKNAAAGLRNRPVAVIIDRNIKSIIAFMGIVYSGNFYVPIDNSMPAERVELIYNTLEPVAVLDGRTNTDKPVEGAIALDEIIVKGEIDEDLLSKIRAGAVDTDPLYGIFTSGSTGVPKAW